MPWSAGARATRSNKQSFWSESQPLTLLVQGPPGKEEANCRYQDTVCFTHAPGGDMRLTLTLSGVNQTLRAHPEFANVTGIHCVRDCAGAEAYLKASFDYRVAHPNASLDTQQLEPEPPDEPPSEFAEEVRRRIPNANAPKTTVPNAALPAGGGTP